MTERAYDAAAIRVALAQRLRAAKTAALDTARSRAVPSDDDSMSASTDLDELMRALCATESRALAWLILAAASAAYPQQEDVVELARRSTLDGASRAALWGMSRAHAIAETAGSPTATMRVATRGEIIADVTGSARSDLHTGVQRVVRETMGLWRSRAELIPAAWTGQFGILRELSGDERRRALHWSVPGNPDGPAPDRNAARTADPQLVVPWKSTVFLFEPVPARATAGLRGLATCSGSPVVALGYDCIPITSAEAVPDSASDSFANYLSVIKHSSRVIGISRSSSSEFSGFSKMLPAQGLAELDVRTCHLPVVAPDAPADNEAHNDEGIPLVLCVGSHAPHKNLLAVLFAADRLWRDGLAFRLVMVGGSGWLSSDFDHVVHDLRRRRRPLSVIRTMDEDELWSHYRAARFTVFASLHEGFGLPVAESLAVGTPVITSSYGSMAEIAAGGGAVTVDPRDDSAILTEMRRLLTSDEAIDELRAAATRRPSGRWSDFAECLWGLVTAPCAD